MELIFSFLDEILAGFEINSQLVKFIRKIDVRVVVVVREGDRAPVVEEW